MHRFVDSKKNCRFESAECTTGTYCEGNGSHGDVVRGFPQIVAVVSAECVPEPVEFSADRLDILLCGFPPVFRSADQSGPSLGRVAEFRQIERHRFSPGKVWLRASNDVSPTHRFF